MSCPTIIKRTIATLVENVMKGGKHIPNMPQRVLDEMHINKLLDVLLDRSKTD